MNYYSTIEENTQSVASDLCSFIAKKYSIENYTMTCEFFGRSIIIKTFINDINKYTIDIFENDKILTYDFAQIGVSKKDVYSFFKYYNRKKVIDGLL